MDDQNLIVLIKLGDKNAFSLLVKRYKELGLSLVMKIIENREDAEEVLQDAFLRVYKGIRSFNGESKFSTWFYKIIFNASITFKEKRTYKTLNIVTVSPDNFKTPNDNYFDSKYFHNKVLSALESLPVEEKLIATLFYLHQQKNSEIGKIMGIPENTVKVKLYRIRHKLQKLLSNIKNDFIYGHN